MKKNIEEVCSLAEVREKLIGVSDSFRGLCGARYLVLSGFSLTQ